MNIINVAAGNGLMPGIAIHKGDELIGKHRFDGLTIDYTIDFMEKGSLVLIGRYALSRGRDFERISFSRLIGVLQLKE